MVCFVLAMSPFQGPESRITSYQTFPEVQALDQQSLCAGLLAYLASVTGTQHRREGPTPVCLRDLLGSQSQIKWSSSNNVPTNLNFSIKKGLKVRIAKVHVIV